MPGIITGAQNPKAQAIIVAKRALPRLKSATVAYSISDPQYESEVRRFGSQVDIPIPAEYTSNLLADGGTINRQNPSLGSASLVLNRHRELSFEITDINEALATPDLQKTALGQAIANFAEDIDEDLLGIYSDFTTTDVGAYNTAITEGTVEAAETTLFNERAPAGIRKSLVLTGDGYSNARQIPRFTEPDKAGAGASARADAFMGQVKGFDVYRDQKVNVTNSGADRHGVALTPTALLTAVRNLGPRAKDGTVQVEVSEDGISLRLTMSYHHEVLGELCTIDTLYGYVAGRTNHGVEVRH